MQPRLRNPAMLIPDALPILQSAGQAHQHVDIPPKTQHLVHMRASQINGCAACIDMRPRACQERHAERQLALAAWRESPLFTRARARRARADRGNHAHQRGRRPRRRVGRGGEHYSETELAGLVLYASMTNCWNRSTSRPARCAGSRLVSDGAPRGLYAARPMARAPDFDLAKELGKPSFTPAQRDAPALVELVVAARSRPRAGRDGARGARRGRRARSRRGSPARSRTDRVARTNGELGERAARLVGALGLLARARRCRGAGGRARAARRSRRARAARGDRRARQARPLAASDRAGAATTRAPRCSRAGTPAMCRPTRGARSSRRSASSAATRPRRGSQRSCRATMPSSRAGAIARA